MTTRAWLLPASMALVFAAVWFFMREPQAGRPNDTPVAARLNAGVASAAPASSARKRAPEAAPAADATVNGLIADTNNPDAQRRAAAIMALAAAPRAQAVPALSHVLLNGEPGVDRPLALRALRELALAQGDADGAVRAAFREVIYHGDDEALQSAAQESLGIVEAASAR